MAALDKLAGNKDYNEVLLLDETPPPAKSGEPEPGTSKDQSQSSKEPKPEGEDEGQPPRKRARATKGQKAPAPKSVKKPITGVKRATAAERFRGVGEAQAAAYNLSDFKEVVELSDFLQKNGGWELFTTPKNGQCLWSSILKGIDVPEEYRASHLRYQFVLFCTKYPEFVFNRLKLHIQVEYGHSRLSREEYIRRSLSEDEPLTDAEIGKYQKPGPFSFLGYLKYMLEDHAWGDEGILTLIGMMWQVCITLVQVEPEAPAKDKPHRFTILNFRHSRPMKRADLVLIFAGQNHYLGSCE